MSKPIIKNADMTEEMRSWTLKAVVEAFDAATREKDAAAGIRQAFDKEFGKTWNVIIGKDFGSDVTHETKHYIQLQYGHLTVLIWKSN